jgi:hypothetical protein
MNKIIPVVLFTLPLAACAQELSWTAHPAGVLMPQSVAETAADETVDISAPANPAVTDADRHPDGPELTEVSAPAQPGMASDLPDVTDSALPPRSVPAVNKFYDDLMPYGGWAWLPRYGWVWRPYAPPAGWRPYSQGHWAESDYGWTWVSDEPYGWACYHYGRWDLDDTCGWVWTPGLVWGPAWVAWRTCDDFVGWVPLPRSCFWRPGIGISFGIGLDLFLGPDRFCFVDRHGFLGEHLHRRLLAPGEHAKFFGRTTFAVNIAHDHGRVTNRMAHEAGFEHTLGQRVTHTRIAAAASPRGVMANKEELRKFRPELREKSPVVRGTSPVVHGRTPASVEHAERAAPRVEHKEAPRSLPPARTETPRRTWAEHAPTHSWSTGHSTPAPRTFAPSAPRTYSAPSRSYSSSSWSARGSSSSGWGGGGFRGR